MNEDRLGGGGIAIEIGRVSCPPPADSLTFSFRFEQEAKRFFLFRSTAVFPRPPLTRDAEQRSFIAKTLSYVSSWLGYRHDVKITTRGVEVGPNKPVRSLSFPPSLPHAECSGSGLPRAYESPALEVGLVNVVFCSKESRPPPRSQTDELIDLTWHGMTRGCRASQRPKVGGTRRIGGRFSTST